MKRKLTLGIIILFLSAFMLDGCTTGKKSKGRQQPKKGPMPCPMKDC